MLRKWLEIIHDTGLYFGSHLAGLALHTDVDSDTTTCVDLDGSPKHIGLANGGPQSEGTQGKCSVVNTTRTESQRRLRAYN